MRGEQQHAGFAAAEVHQDAVRRQHFAERWADPEEGHHPRGFVASAFFLIDAFDGEVADAGFITGIHSVVEIKPALDGNADQFERGAA